MKKMIALITSFMLVVIALVGCSAAPAVKSSAAATKAAATTAAATTAAPATTSASTTTAAPATTSAAASAAAPTKVAGQKWIASDIIGNVTADTATDPTDDFAAYANKDWIVNLKLDRAIFIQIRQENAMMR